MSDAVPVSAPGKAFLIGEYAVLEGAPALVAAIDVRAVAHAGAAGPGSAVVQCAHARVASYLEARGADTIDPPPVVETGGFTMGSRKLGLGSSAAVAAAVIGWHLAAHGLDPQDAGVRRDALALALAAHAEAQGGGGSGADVAAAVLGGVIRFQDGDATPVVMPPWLHVAFVDAGAPAVTSSFVQRVAAGARRDRGAHDDALARLRGAVDKFVTAFSQSHDGDGVAPLRAIGEATRLHNEGLRRLAASSGAPIMTPAIEAIVAAAEKAGLAAKPSGAGGGDLVAVFASSRAEIDRFAGSLRREQGFVTLTDLRAGAEGLRPERRVPTNSRLAGFFRLSVAQRREAVARATSLPVSRLEQLDQSGLDLQQAEHMIENVVGTLGLPLAIATNVRVNGRDYLVPMCVEEASVVAAASNAAKMIREGGGFSAHSDPPWMIAQVQLCAPASEPRHDADAVKAIVLDHALQLRALADGAHPRLVRRGGGAREVEARAVDPAMVVVHVLVDCKDAMGANLLNTVAEAVAPRLEELTGWRAGLRILSNLADRRCAHVSARVPPRALAGKGFEGPEVVERIVSASRFAELDPYRAATHNKGIMNGVDAVVLATGNDWRAMEASAHAYAALKEDTSDREGGGASTASPAGGGPARPSIERRTRYGPLATWRRGADGWLEGTMSLPAAVGVVGGATRVHPVARLALEILDCRSGAELGQVMAAVGLASNLAALRALATEGIQRGHMSLHARSVALGAGAIGPEVEQLSSLLIQDGEIKAERAAELLAQLRSKEGFPTAGEGDPRQLRWLGGGAAKPLHRDEQD